MKPRNEKKLRQVLKQFRTNVFFKHVVPVLCTWVSRETIIDEIQRLKSQTDQRSVADVYVNLLKETELTDEIIEEKLPVFMLFGVACNSSRRTWSAYTLKGDAEGIKVCSTLESDINHAFHENNLYATVVVKALDSAYWVLVTLKKLVRNRLKVSAPFYIAHFVGEPHLFLSRKGTAHEVLECLAKGFGYTGYKNSNLDGPHLESLLSHLNQKGRKRGFVGPPPSNDLKVTQYGNKDYSQDDYRKKFISDLMGPSPPKLSNYAVLAKQLPWRGKKNQPAILKKLFDMRIVFKSNDTVQMLKDMAEIGCLQIPPPSYVRNLLSTGRNNIKLRVQGYQGATDTENQTDA